YASGRWATCRKTDQTELSFKTILSSVTPPNIMAPSRPLPSGVDAVKLVAGASNQIVVSGVKDSLPDAGHKSVTQKATAQETINAIRLRMPLSLSNTTAGFRRASIAHR